MKKSILWILVIAIAFGLTGCDTLMINPPRETLVPTVYTSIEETSVSASAEVAPSKWASLSMLSSGVVDEVLVKDGDEVSEGQVLVRYKGQEDIQARIASAEYALAEAENALDILNQKAATQLATVQKTLADAQKALKDAQDERYRKNLARVSQATIDQKQSDLIIAKDVLKKAKEEYAKYENRPENDLQRAQAFSAMAAAQQKVDQITYDLNWLLSGPDQNEIDRADAAIVVAEANVADAQREYDLRKNGPDPAELKVANARIEDAKAQLLAAQSALAALELRAPFDGVVSDPQVRLGEYIAFGQPVMQLVDPKTLQIETTDLGETDVTRIKVGDVTVVTFDALPDVSISGKVVNISSKASAGSGVNFKVTIELNTIPEGLRWGMTAFVVIYSS